MINLDNVRELEFDDLLSLVEIMAKLQLDEFNLEGMDNPTLAGLKVMSHIAKSTGKAKHDLYKLIGNISGLTGEQVSRLKISEMKLLFKKINEVNNLQEVFIEAWGLMQGN